MPGWGVRSNRLAATEAEPVDFEAHNYTGYPPLAGAPALSRARRWALLFTVAAGLLLVTQDNSCRPGTVDHQCLSAGDGRPAARRRHARRSHRPPPHVPDRPGGVRRCFAGCGIRG
ncbi:hypothetical protein G6F59_017352 [Rhizopus arrhizus]|nr:hypothetical protein G6F59_017352 [Rhizopus arrhizus]